MPEIIKTIRNKTIITKNIVLSVLVLIKQVTLLELIIISNIAKNKEEISNVIAYGAADGIIQNGKDNAKSIINPKKDF